jgi:hypothetical protein
MQKITIKTEHQTYRGIETVSLGLANGETIEVKAWDNERNHSGMDYSIRLRSKDGVDKELA